MLFGPLRPGQVTSVPYPVNRDKCQSRSEGGFGKLLGFKTVVKLSVGTLGFGGHEFERK